MHQTKRISIKSATVAGIAFSALLGLAGVTLNPAPANAVVVLHVRGLSRGVRCPGRRRAQAASRGARCGSS